MNRSKKFLVILLFAVVPLASCAKRLVVTFESVPSGARCYMEYDGRRIDLGECPTTRVWEITPAAENAGYIQVPPLKYVWVSGATQTSPGPVRFRVDNCSFSFNDPIATGCSAYWTYTMHPPESAPGREIDFTYGLQADRNRQLQRQAEAQEEQARIQRRRYWLELSRPAESND